MDLNSLSYTEKYALVRDPDIDISQLVELAKDADTDLLCYVAEHPNCPATLLENLAHDSESVVRCCVASNRNTPAHLLVTFASDEDWDVRSAAAKNANLPVKLMSQLAQDEYEDVRCGVAANRNCTVELLVALADDEDDGVRSQVAGHPHCPATLLVTLVGDDGTDVQSNALRALRSKDSAFWEKVILEGFSLSTLIGRGTAQKASGEILLEAKLSDVYQSIQSAEIARRITKTTSNPAGFAEPDQNSLPRTSSLRM